MIHHNKAIEEQAKTSSFLLGIHEKNNRENLRRIRHSHTARMDTDEGKWIILAYVRNI